MHRIGSDTSTTAINTCLFYLANHPRERRRLENELHRCFPTLAGITTNTAENCRYLRACLDEAVRLCPLVPSSIPRVVGEGGLRAAGEDVAAGLWVSVPHFTLFRNAKYFRRPHEYIPGRWIVETPDGQPPANGDDNDIQGGHGGAAARGGGGYTAEEVKLAQTAFQPFSIGPRHCIARSLALREMTFILARIFYLFDVEPASENSGRWEGSLPGIDSGHFIHEQWDVFTSLERGPSLKIKRKEGLQSRI